ncbi:MAG: FAD-dependent oxidoreductase [Burkholderiaceae bacterium]
MPEVRRNQLINTDLVVIGAGAAGMTAALVAALNGRQVTLIEKSALVGGTSSRSAGTLWVPGNHFMTAAESESDLNQARQYLDALVDSFSPVELRLAFLAQGPAMLRYLTSNTAIRFKPCPHHADYHPELPGAKPGGRPVEPELFDARLLGKHFKRLRSPIQEFMVFGGMMVSKADINLLLRAGRHWDGTVHASRLLCRYLFDRFSHPRGTRLTMGNALCASLLFECLKHQVEILTETETTSIEATGGPSYRLQVQCAGQARAIQAGLGVVFAGGGFSGSADQRREHLPAPAPLNTAAFEGADGSSQALAMAMGAQFGPSCQHNAWWFPSSLITRNDGTTGVFPHIIMDRAKPGLIAVDRNGSRFANEGLSYHQFSRAQYASNAIPCWLICDDHFIRRYGLGVIRPGGTGLRAALRTRYVHRSKTLGGLAAQIGIDAGGLMNSVQRMNRFATTGIDEDFGKGADSLSRQNGDPEYRGVNPCLGPVDTAPFYAVQVRPADLGTSRGLLTDIRARLLDSNGKPIPGLYACGNDMQSVMGGQYPAPGVTLGPAMTFAYVAALDCAAAETK